MIGKYVQKLEYSSQDCIIMIITIKANNYSYERETKWHIDTKQTKYIITNGKQEYKNENGAMISLFSLS